MPTYMYDYPPLTADAEEKEEEDLENLSDAAAIAIEIVGGIVLTLFVGFNFVKLVKFMCDAPSEGNKNSENSGHNIGGNRRRSRRERGCC